MKLYRYDSTHDFTEGYELGVDLCKLEEPRYYGTCDFKHPSGRLYGFIINFKHFHHQKYFILILGYIYITIFGCKT